MMKESIFTVWEPMKLLDSLPVVMDKFGDGVCNHIRGHGAIDGEGESFEVNGWLVLVPSVNRVVLESFEIRI